MLSKYRTCLFSDSNMRIIAGTKHGMNLVSPKTYNSRPILDRVKESLFNVLCKYDLIEGNSIADLFCGVGSLGLEALSRGAASAIFVEKDPKTIAVLKSNIERIGFDSQSRIIRANAFIIGAPVDQQKYSIIFVDPPYPLTKNVAKGSQLSNLLELLTGQLAPDGIVVVRTEKHTELLPEYGVLEIIDKRRWGSMLITLLSNKKDDQ